MDLSLLGKLLAKAKVAYDKGFAFFGKAKSWVLAHKKIVLAVAIALVLFKIC